MTLTLHQFVQQLTNSGLIHADEVQSFIVKLLGSEQPVDAEAVAKQLLAK